MKDFILWIVSFIFPKDPEPFDNSRDGFNNIADDLDSLFSKESRRRENNKREIAMTEEEIKRYPDYHKFKKPTVKKVLFNPEQAYLHVGNVTGLRDEKAAIAYANKRYKQADDLLQLKAKRKTDPEFKDMSNEHLIQYIQRYNKENYPKTQKKGIWEYNLDDKIKASRPNCHGHSRPIYDSNNDTYINVDPLPRKSINQESITTFFDKNIKPLSEYDDLPELEEVKPISRSNTKRKRKKS